jgi:hypothetical protein
MKRGKGGLGTSLAAATSKNAHRDVVAGNDVPGAEFDSTGWRIACLAAIADERGS